MNLDFSTDPKTSPGILLGTPIGTFPGIPPRIILRMFLNILPNILPNIPLGIQSQGYPLHIQNFLCCFVMSYAGPLILSKKNSKFSSKDFFINLQKGILQEMFSMESSCRWYSSTNTSRESSLLSSKTTSFVFLKDSFTDSSKFPYRVSQ